MFRLGDTVYRSSAPASEPLVRVTAEFCCDVRRGYRKMRRAGIARSSARMIVMEMFAFRSLVEVAFDPTHFSRVHGQTAHPPVGEL